MPVKEFIKNRPRLVRTIHHLRFLSWQPSSVNSHVILSNLALRQRSVKFMQIGSNDGVTGDPLHSFVRNYGWKGVLVEPLPEIMTRLQANYSGVPGLKFENCVISNRTGKCPLYTLLEVNGHNSSQVSSLVFEVISKQKEYMPDFAERFSLRYVNSMNINDLLERHGMENFELLHIDAEGYDAEILKMLDHHRFKPEVIFFESEHLTPENYRECLSRLRQNGFSIFFRDGQDTIALRSAAYL